LPGKPGEKSPETVISQEEVTTHRKWYNSLLSAQFWIPWGAQRKVSVMLLQIMSLETL